MNATNREVILLGPLKPLIVKGLEAHRHFAQVRRSEGSSVFLCRTSRCPGDCLRRHERTIGRRFHAALSQIADHFELRRRLRPYRRQSRGRPRRHCHQHPGSLDRGGGRHGSRLAVVTVREFPGRTLSARRQLAAEDVSADQEPCAIAPSASSAWARSGKPLRAGSTRFRVRVVYHARQPRPQLRYRHYPKLIDMARDVDTLMVIVPGGPATANMINAEVLNALGPERHSDQHGARLGGR